MQPVSYASSESATTEKSQEQSQQPSSQHGLHDHRAAVSLHSAEDAAATSFSEQYDAAFAASLQDMETGLQTTQQRRLSSRASPSPPPARNRIEEYENASTPPIKRRELPAFEVIKKPRSPGDKRSPIQDLPNGTLHTLEAQVTGSADYSQKY